MNYALPCQNFPAESGLGATWLIFRLGYHYSHMSAVVKLGMAGYGVVRQKAISN